MLVLRSFDFHMRQKKHMENIPTDFVLYSSQFNHDNYSTYIHFFHNDISVSIL